MKQIVVTIRKCVQIGPDDYEMEAISGVFAINRSIKDMLKWAESCGFKDAKIGDLHFSEYAGSSI